MNIKEHADNLAQALQVMAPDAPELQEYRDALRRRWLRAGAACTALDISRRTLVRWRQENRIEPGKHWRRMGSGSHCLYDVRALEEQMNEWAR
jgi:hypothetical protein